MVGVLVKKTIVAIIVLLSFSAMAVNTMALVSVGVKKGDWIEYQVTSSGTLPDQAHDVVAARLEVEEVQGMLIHIRIFSNYSDGTQSSTSSTLNLETGQLIDDFIIPAGLTIGDSFVDSNVGSMTITSMDQRTYAGATRSVVSAKSGDNTYFWDQETGVSVEGMTESQSFTIHTVATATNIWQPQNPQDLVVVYSFIIALLIVLIVVAIVVIKEERNRY